jgi:hypothetical protein
MFYRISGFVAMVTCVGCRSSSDYSCVIGCACEAVLSVTSAPHPYLACSQALVILFFLAILSLNSGSWTYQAGTLPLDAHLHPFLVWLFLRWALTLCPGWPGLQPSYLHF